MFMIVNVISKKSLYLGSGLPVIMLIIVIMLILEIMLMLVNSNILTRVSTLALASLSSCSS